MAGNWVQLIIFMGICVGWVSTYVYRVATKARRAALRCAATCSLLSRHCSHFFP